MNREEAIKELDALTDADREAAHGDADGILLVFLRAQGFGDVADAWTRTEQRIGF